MERQKIVYKKLSEIKPYKNNARKHDKKQIEQLANSIEKLGFRGVILIDKNNTVIAGHGRCLAAKKAGLKEIPCVYVDDLSEDQIKALRLIDNKIAEGSKWDDGLLSLELGELSEVGFNMSDFGFENLAISQDKEKEYTTKTSVPQYEVTGVKPKFSEMVDTTKYNELVERIENSSLSTEEKKFLKMAATRHLCFNYKNVAEYYANVASKEMQELMEESALVIIDFDDAIRYGYVDLMNGILQLEEEDENG